MSALGTVAVVLLAVWLGAISIALLATVRQVALLTLRLDREDKARELDGLSIGSSVPAEVASVLPNGTHERTFLLLLEAECGPCRELVDGIHGQEFEERVVAVIVGEQSRAQALAERLPPSFSPVLGDEATAALKSLDVATSPFLFLVEGDAVAGKNGPRNAAHFRTLVTGELSTHHQDANQQNGRPLVEVTHVN
jgi:hypothetical protein